MSPNVIMRTFLYKSNLSETWVLCIFFIRFILIPSQRCNAFQASHFGVLFTSIHMPSRSATTTRRSFLRASPNTNTRDSLLACVKTVEKVVQSSEMIKQMCSKCMKSIEIKESSIPGAGLGLFAKKNIKAKTIVSFYPAHALGIDIDGAEGDSISTFVASSDKDQEYFQNHPSARSSYLHCTDQPIFKRPSMLSLLDESVKDIPLYLDVNPNKEIKTGWVSQMINDGATVDTNTEQGVLDYYNMSGKNKNCIHIPFGPSPIMATVTTKKVKKGDELFTSYGCTYWLGVLLDMQGEENAVGSTNKIQIKIRETANDLFQSMESVKLLYGNQIRSIENEFNTIFIE